MKYTQSLDSSEPPIIAHFYILTLSNWGSKFRIKITTHNTQTWIIIPYILFRRKVRLRSFDGPPELIYDDQDQNEWQSIIRADVLQLKTPRLRCVVSAGLGWIWNPHQLVSNERNENVCAHTFLERSLCYAYFIANGKKQYSGWKRMLIEWK